LGRKNHDENKKIINKVGHMADDVLACRCMEISERSVREAIRQGATTVDAVKRATMAGMGLCQSKTCFNIIARLICEETGIPVSQIRPMKIRIPVRPVKISSLDMGIQPPCT
jgi:NAD(P)H-nitrite reductase large subunit